MKWGIALATLLLTTTAGVLLLSSNTPAVQVSSAEQLADADALPQLLRDLGGVYEGRSEPQTLNISQRQLNALLGSAQRALPTVSGIAKIGSYSAFLELSYQLPINRYLNIRVDLGPGSNIPLQRITVGALSIPITWFWWVTTAVGDGYLGDGVIAEAKSTVTSVALSEGNLRLALGPSEALIAKLQYWSEQSKLDQLTPLQQLVHFYLSALATMEQPPQGQDRLAFRLSKLFAMASTRSDEKTAADHNAAVVFALAIFDGGYPLRHLIGNIHRGNVSKPEGFVPAIVQGRRDLYLHFVYSAAIQLFSSRGLSFATGEVKEMMDRSADGSGFSFTDLAADAAGIAFAERLSSQAFANATQGILAANQTDALYFPRIDGLQENLTKDEFEARYLGVDSEPYARAVNDIEQRIAQLPLYQMSADKERH